MKRYTDSTLNALPAPREVAEVYRVHDCGLQDRIYPTGSRSFGYIARNASGYPQFRTLGKHLTGKDRPAGSLTFDEAREKYAERSLGQLKEKHGGKVTPSRALSVLDTDMTLNSLLKVFMEKVINLRPIKQDRKDRWRRTLQTHFLDRKIPDGGGTWGELCLSEFIGASWHDAYETTLKKVEAERDRAGDRRGPCTLAHQTDQFAQQLFSYAVKRQLMSRDNVPTRLQDVNKPRNIERSLAIREIETMLAATSVKAVTSNTGMKEYDAVFLRLTLFTGVRVNSMRQARRAQLNATLRGFWTFQAEVLKQTSRQRRAPTDLLVPITPLIASELKRLETTSGDYDWLFPERWVGEDRDVKPRSDGWAKHVVTEHADLLKNKGANAWTAHALRRTMSNMMRELGIPNHVIDVASARVPQGTGKTYLTSEMRDQVSIAFEKYHGFLNACIEGVGEEWMQDVFAERKQDTAKELEERHARVKRKAAAARKVA